LSLSPPLHERVHARPDLLSFPTRRSSDLTWAATAAQALTAFDESQASDVTAHPERARNASLPAQLRRVARRLADPRNFLRKIAGDRKSTRLNSSHVSTSYAVFCLKKKKQH